MAATTNEAKLKFQHNTCRHSGLVIVEIAGGKSAIESRVINASIDVEVLVETVIDDERPVIIRAGRVGRRLDRAGGRFAYRAEKSVLLDVIVGAGKGPAQGSSTFAPVQVSCSTLSV